MANTRYTYPDILVLKYGRWPRYEDVIGIATSKKYTMDATRLKRNAV